MSRLLPPGHDTRVVSFTAYLAALNAQLAAQLLAETPDQAEQARLWGDRDRRAS